MCGKHYSTSGNLGRHCRYECVYTASSAEFKCPHCDYFSKRKDYLKYHVLTHFKVKKRRKSGKEFDDTNMLNMD